MVRIVVTSDAAGAGKTAVATAAARSLAYAGVSVTLTRLASNDAASFAAEDAATYGSLEFAPGSPAVQVVATGLKDTREDGIDIVEADGADAAGIESDLTIVVTRANGETAIPEGVTPSAIVIVGQPKGRPAPEPPEGVAQFVLGEDRTLAGFSVDELRDLLQAEVLNEGDVDDPICDYLVVAPFGSDAGLPYFDRFRHKAVVARFDRTDMHLAAIRSEPSCLVLTGGRHPSDYVFDASRATGVPMLLSWGDTESTVIALEELWDRTRFAGERKLDRMDALLGEQGFNDWLAEKLA